MIIKKLIYTFLVLSLCVGGIALAQPATLAMLAQSSKLVAVDADALARFGASVAVDGDTAVIGAPAADGNAQASGAAYVFSFDGSVWQQQAKLVAANGVALGNFGRAVAMDGDVIVVGAGGAAYIFRYDVAATQWVEEAKLERPTGGLGRFGWAVAVSGERILVGAPYPTGSTKGYVYFFHHVGNGVWELEKSFNTMSSTLGDHYGVALDMEDNLAVVGAPGWGQVYVYEHDGVNWQQGGEVRDPSWGSNRAFGQAVALYADVLLIGTPADPEQGNNAGATYVYRRTTGGWVQQTKLIPPYAAVGARFGWSVDTYGDIILIGAPQSDSQQDIEKSGAAFVFRGQDEAWIFETELNASDAAAFDHLGTAVVVNDNHVLVGAPDKSAGNDINAGAVYYFAMENVTPTPPPLPPPDDPPPPPDDVQVCVAEEQSTEEIVPGVTLTWDSALRCLDAPDEGVYAFNVRVESAITDTTVVLMQPVTMQGVTLTHTTPRPLGQAPDASVDMVTGLPFTIESGQVQTFTITGTYELATAGVARLANLHFCATGYDNATRQPFYLGLNTFLRGPGMDDDNHTQLSPPPPVIGQINVTPGSGSAIISWLTDVPATSEVIFYPTGAPELQRTVNRGCLAVEDHQISVNGLLPETEYTVQVQSRTGPDGVATSDALTFTTTEPGDVQVCVAEEQSSEEVVPGVTLTWDSALRCLDAPLDGVYTFNVRVESTITNTTMPLIQPLTMQAVTLTHTTPRPQGLAPTVSVDMVTGLPFTIDAELMYTFTVTGTYELAAAGVARLANLHFCATGYDNAAGQPFYLGLNTFLRGTGTIDDGTLLLLPPPVIGQISVTPGLGGAIISWLTDVPATSEVIFYPTGAPELQRTVNRGCLTADNHQIALSGLMPATEYTYQVRARTGVNSVATSSASTFTTPDFVRVFLPLIIKR